MTMKFDLGWQPEDDFDDEAADLYCEGWLARSNRQPRPSNPHAAEGWDDSKAQEGVVVVMPRRPEGYYHMPLGTFE